MKRVALCVMSMLMAGFTCPAINAGEPNACHEPEWDMVLKNRLMFRANVFSEQAKAVRVTHSDAEFKVYRKSVREHLKKVLFDDEDVTCFRGKPLRENRVGEPFTTAKYTMYRIAYESIPGCYVPANLYVPNGVKFPVPGIIAISDHCPGGKSAPYNQSLGIVFASKGYVTLVIDFPGRGEMVNGNDHFVNGVQMAATGLWSNYLFIVNAVRAVDYLQSRCDIVDPNKIGMTGTSGGGATTLIAAACDNRIVAGVACCCVEPFEQCLRLAYTSCPEYLTPSGLTAPLEWSDMASLVVPRSLVLLRAKKDSLFTQAGFDQMVNETAKFYRINNTPDHFRIVETNEPHTYSAAMREVAYFWFGKWLGIPNGENLPTWRERILEPNDVSYTLLDSQIKLEAKSRLAVGVESTTNLHTIAMERAGRFAHSRYAYTSKDFGKKEVDEISDRVSRFYNPPKNFADMTVRQIGVSWDANTVTERIILEPSPGVTLPAKLIRLMNIKPKGALLYLDEEGTNGLGKHGFDKLPASGIVVLSVDITGMGKLYPRASEWDKYEWCDISRILSYSSWTMDTSVPHLQISDALAALAYLKQCNGSQSVPLYVAGIGRGAPVALMITAISSDVDGLIGINSLISYRNYVDEPLPNYNIMAISYGVLKEFDIPVVLAAVSDRLIVWAAPVDANKKPASETVIRQIYELACSRIKEPEKVFRTSGGADCIQDIERKLNKQ